MAHSELPSQATEAPDAQLNYPRQLPSSAPGSALPTPTTLLPPPTHLQRLSSSAHPVPDAATFRFRRNSAHPTSSNNNSSGSSHAGNSSLQSPTASLHQSPPSLSSTTAHSQAQTPTLLFPSHGFDSSAPSGVASPSFMATNAPHRPSPLSRETSRVDPSGMEREPPSTAGLVYSSWVRRGGPPSATIGAGSGHLPPPPENEPVPVSLAMSQTTGSTTSVASSTAAAAGPPTRRVRAPLSSTASDFRRALPNYPPVRYTYYQNQSPLPSPSSSMMSFSPQFDAHYSAHLNSNGGYSPAFGPEDTHYNPNGSSHGGGGGGNPRTGSQHHPVPPPPLSAASNYWTVDSRFSPLFPANGGISMHHRRSSTQFPYSPRGPSSQSSVSSSVVMAMSNMAGPSAGSSSGSGPSSSISSNNLLPAQMHRRRSHQGMVPSMDSLIAHAGRPRLATISSNDDESLLEGTVPGTTATPTLAPLRSASVASPSGVAMNGSTGCHPSTTTTVPSYSVEGGGHHRSGTRLASPPPPPALQPLEPTTMSNHPSPRFVESPLQLPSIDQLLVTTGELLGRRQHRASTSSLLSGSNVRSNGPGGAGPATPPPRITYSSPDTEMTGSDDGCHPPHHHLQQQPA
ncbi:hypothetical protein H4R33_005696, partial [Dimargaris cristalligena]